MTQNDHETTRGFRPGARRRSRIAAGVAMGAAAIGGNLLLYSSLDGAAPVVQAVQDIPAGTQITPEMLRTVDVDIDASVLAVPGDQLTLVPGRYAKVRIVSGSLVVEPALQDAPLVSDGSSVIAIEVPRSLVPTGVREQSTVRLVYRDAADTQVLVAGQVVGLPLGSDDGVNTTSLSIEVIAEDAPGIVLADDVRIVLLAPAAPEASG